MVALTKYGFAVKPNWLLPHIGSHDFSPQSPPLTQLRIFLLITNYRHTINQIAVTMRKVLPYIKIMEH